jgi:phosphomannomutase
VHVRPSNTESIIRCYAEAVTEKQARELARMVMEKIRF